MIGRSASSNWDLFYDLGTTRYFLLNGDTWLTAPDPLKGPWMPATSLPKGLSTLPKEPQWADVKKAIPGRRVTTAPVVFTAITPAEMILVGGAPLDADQGQSHCRHRPRTSAHRGDPEST
jgi:hypothetical protein